MLRGLFSQLWLSRDQKMAIVQAVRGALAENAGEESPAGAMRERMRKMGESFKSDRFGDDEAPSADSGRNMSRGIKRIIRILEAVLPVLTAEQRVKLASLIRDKVTKSGAQGPHKTEDAQCGDEDLGPAHCAAPDQQKGDHPQAPPVR
jgi:hypothetical protein